MYFQGMNEEIEEKCVLFMNLYTNQLLYVVISFISMPIKMCKLATI